MNTVTQEQIDQAKIWEKKLAEGGCNLNDALYMCMASGAPISANMLQRYDAAINSYTRGEYEDLAEAFGFAQSKRQKNVMLKYLKKLKVKDLVDFYSELDFKKIDPAHFEGTAFEKAGKDLGLSPTRVYDIYYKE